MRQTILLLASILLLFASCKENDKKRITRLVTEWQDKEIAFPENITFTRYTTDTIFWQMPSADYKVLIYVDPFGCTNCKLQLPKWKDFIAYTDSVTGGKVPFLFFIHAKDTKEISYMLKRDGFDYPVHFDREDKLNELNQFPADLAFQTFLLDKNNKVVVLGNPIHNLAVKDLYLKQITGKESPKQIKTTAKVEETEFNFGTFALSDTKKATFTLLNTGLQPLVIIDAATTCGCAVVSFDKHPAQAGDSLQVEVEMSPKESGFFNETITVRCNTERPIQLKIRGQVL